MTAFAILSLLAILAAIATSAIFSGAESAVVSASRYRLDHRSREGEKGARGALAVLERNHSVLTAILVGNNLANVLLVLFFQGLLEETWPGASEPAIGFVRWDEVVAILLLTPVIVVFAEILPKAVFRARADSLIVPLSPFLRLILFVLRPVVATLDLLTTVALRLLPGSNDARRREMTRADVILMLNRDRESRDDDEDEEEPEDPRVAPEDDDEPEDADDTPSFMRDPDERTLVRNILELDRRLAGEIMRPLVELDAVHLGQVTREAFLDRARRSGYTRYPAYRRRITGIVGYIDVYDVMRGEESRSLEECLRPVHFVPDTKRVDDLLAEFLERKLETTVVVNEHGGCVGWITLEDILEEIVGELEDELDQPEPLVRERTEDSMLVEGRISVELANEVLAAEMPTSHCDTLGGIVMMKLGRIPRVGDEVVVEDWRIKVLEMDGMRVGLTRATRLDAHGS